MLKLALFVILLGVGVYFLNQYAKGVKCELKNNINGKNVLITGANTGIGYETAKELAKRGGIIHMACRDDKKCSNARSKILAELKIDGNNIKTYNLDLASIKSIITFVNVFKSTNKELDILINNAGVMMCPYMETVDGFEMQIGTNHLGHFLLTNQLLPLLKESKKQPRIIIVSSNGHRHGSINRTDINLRGDAYGRMAAYTQSKLANILHAKYLSRLLKNDGIAVISLHPGAINTELGRHLPEILRMASKILEHVFIKTPFEGAQTQICAAVDPDLMSKTGEYFDDYKPIKSGNSEVYDEELEKWLWEHSEALLNEKLKNL